MRRMPTKIHGEGGILFSPFLPGPPPPPPPCWLADGKARNGKNITCFWLHQLATSGGGAECTVYSEFEQKYCNWLGEGGFFPLKL